MHQYLNIFEHIIKHTFFLAYFIGNMSIHNNVIADTRLVMPTVLTDTGLTYLYAVTVTLAQLMLLKLDHAFQLRVLFL